MIQDYLSDAFDLLPRSKDKISRRFRRAKYLSSGSYGSVFSLSEDHVVKFTMDESEILAARRLMKNPVDCCVRVYDARSIQDGIWQIITEKVTPLRGNPDIVHAYETAYCEYKIPGYRWDKKNFWLNNSILFLREIEKVGFTTHDLHDGNVGIRTPYELVALDLGMLVDYDD